MADEEIPEQLVLALQNEEIKTRAKANIIKQNLLTQDQKIRLYEMDYSISDLVEGNVARDDVANVLEYFYHPWNQKCGVKVFTLR